MIIVGLGGIMKQPLISIYPNPSNGNMYLEYVGLTGDALFEMYDVAVRKITFYQLRDRRGEINIREERLERGVYRYHIYNTHTTFDIGKIVIQR